MLPDVNQKLYELNKYRAYFLPIIWSALVFRYNLSPCSVVNWSLIQYIIPYIEEILPNRGNRGICRMPMVYGRQLDHRKILSPLYALVINKLSWENYLFVVAEKSIDID